MKLLLKTQIISFSILILLLFLPGFSLGEIQDESEPVNHTALQEPAQSGGNIIPVPIGLKQNKELSPEFPKEGSTDSIVSCPNGFTPAWWSIRKHRGSTEWRDVGTWETPKINKPLQAQGTIRFAIWVIFRGSGQPTSSNFEFNWLRNDETIATVRAEDVDLRSEMNPLKIVANAHLVNQTPFAAGDVFKLFIRCQISLDGTQILYGSREHFSAVIMICDPIDIVDIKTCKESIKCIYNEVFKVNPNSMTYIAKLDNIIVSAIPELQIETINEINYRTVKWKINIKPGTHNIEISISYIENDNSTFVTLIKQITIKKEPEPNFLGIPLWIVHTIVALVAFVIIVGVGLKLRSYYEERHWLELEAAGFE